ncbi:hypothetical protein Huta_0211 [Halorhabdus utahensis DSM 12940]|uniref:CARDB domain-containing protein n=2 Tax=Halorhabdus utahensis TaxID=146826 RepID=C7NPV2_HALUD|nr:hypothetical protein Huta_0211 [Halorhabdus utahensis DSM 12940]
MNGSGTESNPYEITDLDELQAMEEDLSANYILRSDIDARQTEDWNKGLGFDPIGPNTSSPFRGTFDGNNHVITGLSITRVSEENVGLFGVISKGSVRSLHLHDVDIRGDVASAGLVGFLKNGNVNTSTITGKVYGSDSVGGAAGALYGGQIKNTMTNIRAIGSGNGVGGMAGVQNPDSKIFASISHGNITADGNPTGGFVGSLNARAEEVRNSFSTARVDGTAQAGGFFGNADSVWPTLSELYWDMNLSGTEEGVGRGSRSATGLTTEQMTGPSAKENMEYLFVGTDFMTTDGYPVLEQHVQNVDISLTNSLVSVEDTTDITVTLDLYDGTSTTATKTSDYDLSDEIVTIENGTVTPSETGQTTISVAVNGKTANATLDVRTPADISMADAQLDTATILANSTASVSATLENDGGLPGSDSLTLTADGETVATDTLHVGGHDETTATFSWSVGQAGTYDITFGDRNLGELTVLNNDSVTLRNVIAPKTVTPGGTYDVKAIFENTADTAVSVPVTYRGDEQTVEDRIRVAPSGTTHTFEVNASKPTGRTITHAVSFGETTRRTNTTMLAPATFEVAALDVPETVDEGETVTVTATVRNTGDVSGSTEVVLGVGGDERPVETLSLDGGQTRAIDADVIADTTGTLELTVDAGGDSLTESISIRADVDVQTTTAATDSTTSDETGSSGTATTDGTPDNESTLTDSDSPPTVGESTTTTTSGPGFGVLVAMVALLGGALLIARQH